MALYSGRSLFQVHYTDYEEFPRVMSQNLHKLEREISRYRHYNEI